MEKYLKYLSSDLEIVSDTLGWLDVVMSHQEIMKYFPEINKTHILATLNFTANR